jgi:hypothetical protein
LAQGPQSPDRLDAKTLRDLAVGALTTTSVDLENREELSLAEQRVILDYPHRFVPITSERRLVTIVDRNRLALALALAAVRRRPARLFGSRARIFAKPRIEPVTEPERPSRSE